MEQQQPTLLREADTTRGCVANLMTWLHFSPGWKASIMHILLYTKGQPLPCSSGGSWNQKRFALSSLWFLLILAKILLWAKLATLWCYEVGGAAAPQSNSPLVEAHGFTTEQQPSCWRDMTSFSLHNPQHRGYKELCTPQVKHIRDVTKWRKWLP